MAALLEGLRALGSGRVLDDVLTLVLDSAIEVTGAERGFIMLAEPGAAARVQARAGQGETDAAGSHVRVEPKDSGAGVCHWPAGDRRGSSGGGDRSSAHGHRRARYPPCAVLAAAAGALRRTRRAVHGRSGDHRRAVPRQPGAGSLRSASTRAALETLSAEAALAIENARLYRAALDKARYEQELNLAASIQQAMLPAENRAGAFFASSAASVPCRAVGGDFFDYADLPDGAFGFILGDVAGKGPSAALLAAAMLGMFSAEAAYQAGAALARHAAQRRTAAARRSTRGS